MLFIVLCFFSYVRAGYNVNIFVNGTLSLSQVNTGKFTFLTISAFNDVQKLNCTYPWFDVYSNYWKIVAISYSVGGQWIGQPYERVKSVFVLNSCATHPIDSSSICNTTSLKMYYYVITPRVETFYTSTMDIDTNVMVQLQADTTNQARTPTKIFFNLGCLSKNETTIEPYKSSKFLNANITNPVHLST